MIWPWFVPMALQVAVFSVDELHYHRRRGLPAWERWGHPVDALGLAACVAATLVGPISPGALDLYVVLCILSSLLITKDEWVHAKICPGGEHWLHALLFLVHPLVLISLGVLWARDEARAARGLFLAAVIACAIYQTIYWNVVRGSER
jgi:hypothetical protein